jgi:hypothetical protein
VLVVTEVVDVVFDVVVDMPVMVVEVGVSVVIAPFPLLNVVVDMSADPPPPQATSIALNIKYAPQRKENIGNLSIFIFYSRALMGIKLRVTNFNN